MNLIPLLCCEQASDQVEVKTRTPVLIRLKAYLEQLLEGSYELLMATVRKMLEPGMGISRLGREDFMRFLGFAKICTSFVRQKQVQLSFCHKPEGIIALQFCTIQASHPNDICIACLSVSCMPINEQLSAVCHSKRVVGT